MSLDFDLTKIKNWTEVCNMTSQHDIPMDGIKVGDRIRRPKTSAIIWAMLAVEGSKTGAITEENAEDIFKRIYIWERVVGALLQNDEGPMYITFEEVKAHIGLSTNVFPKITDDKFMKKLMSTVYIKKEG